MLVPFINRKAIKADYFTANARQLQAVYNYQRPTLEAVAEVVSRLSKVQNYLSSIEIKKQVVQSLEASVEAATSPFQNPRADTRIDYLDVLTAQCELLDARRLLIDTKKEQLSAVVNTYHALGGGGYLFPLPVLKPLQSHPWWHHLSLTKAGREAERAPKPLPAPAAAERAPEAIPDLEPLLAMSAARGPAPLPATAPARSPEPSATTTGGGTGAAGGQGSATVSNAGKPPG